MHESLQAALTFPDYYGENFNALNDVIPDLDVPDDGGVALVLTSYDLYANGPAHHSLDRESIRAKSFWIICPQLHTHIPSDRQADPDDDSIKRSAYALRKARPQVTHVELARVDG
jgi:hypothetical protein